MVDQRTQSDSEQVLNSVRRLVAARSEPEPVSSVERLLLTPSLRVDDAGAEVAPSAPEKPSEPLKLSNSDGLEARIAELEAAVSRQLDGFEPDGSEEIDEETPHRFVFTHTPRESVEDADLVGVDAGADEAAEAVPEAPGPEDSGEPTRDAVAAEPAGEPDARDPISLSDEMVIDEEMLRDLVAEIVRSELQGELGERITRNVRKLVRREIHRAIMTRDFG